MFLYCFCLYLVKYTLYIKSNTINFKAKYFTISDNVHTLETMQTPLINTQTLVFLWYQSSRLILAHRTLEKATESTEERLPVDNKSNIKLTLILLTWTIWRAPTNASKWRMGFNSAFKGLNTTICLSFIYVKCNKSIANLKLIDNLIYCMWRTVLTDFTTWSGIFWPAAAIDCLRAISDGMISVECRPHEFLNSYRQTKFR